MAVIVVRDRRTRVGRRRPVHPQARHRRGLDRRRVRLARRLAAHVGHRHRDRLRRRLLPCPSAAGRRHYHHVLVVAGGIGRIDTHKVLRVLVVGRRVERQRPRRRPDGEERPVRAARDRVARDVVARIAVRRHHLARRGLVLRRVELIIRRERRGRVGVLRPAAARVRPRAGAVGVGRPHLHLIGRARRKARERRRGGRAGVVPVRPVAAGACPVLHVVVRDGRAPVVRRRPDDRQAGGRRGRHRRRSRRARHVQHRQRQVARGLDELIAIVFVGQDRLGGQVDVRGHRPGRAVRAGHADPRALPRTGRNRDRGRPAHEAAVRHAHDQRHRERRRGQHHRADLDGIRVPLQRHGQRQRVYGVFAQIERRQRGQVGEHAGGKRTELVAEQREIRQRGQVGEHAGGKRGELVVTQTESRQRGQAGEHTGGKRTELVVTQTESRQRGQVGEHAGGKRTELVGFQSEIRQRGQVGKHASGKRGELVAEEREIRQRGQVGEHAGGKRTELVADQSEIRQRGQAGEHAGGKRTELVAVQIERFQCRQAGERADGKRTELVVAQSEIRQRGQAEERADGKRTELVVAQIERFQCRQAGERADGKRTELVADQREIRQRGQAREVARLQGLDDNRGEIQRHHAGQLRRRDDGAVRHAGDLPHDLDPHLLGAAAEAVRRRRLTGRHLVAVAVSVHYAQLERVGHVVGQARHHDPVLVALAHLAVVDLLPVVVVARGLEAVLVVPDIRVLRRRVPGERHLPVAVRHGETRRPGGQGAWLGPPVRPAGAGLLVLVAGGTDGAGGRAADRDASGGVVVVGQVRGTLRDALQHLVTLLRLHRGDKHTERGARQGQGCDGASHRCGSGAAPKKSGGVNICAGTIARPVGGRFQMHGNFSFRLGCVREDRVLRGQ